MGKNDQILKVRKVTPNFNTVAVRLLYHDSLTLIRTPFSKQKEGKVIRAVFNSPANSPILKDDFNTNRHYDLRTTGSFQTLNLDTKRNHYYTNQALRVGERALALKDKSLFSLLMVPSLNMEDALLLTNELDNPNPSKYQIYKKEDFEEAYFPIYEDREVLVLTEDGNIVRRPNEALKSKDALLESYKEMVLKELANLGITSLRDGFSNYLQTSMILKEYQEGSLPPLYPVCPLLYAFHLQENGTMKIEKLEVFEFDDEHYFVKSYNIFLPSYNKDYLDYLKRKTK